jgi:glutathione S-transferase
MTQLKLTYFDFSASRGEECRLALHLAGVAFNDHRIKFDAWPALKPDTPYGGLPLLEQEGKPPLAESNAILLYVGTVHGLHPTDPWESARHVSVMQAVEDLRGALGPLGQIKDEEEKKSSRAEFAAGYLTTWAQSIEAQIEGPFVGGEALQVADLKVYMITHAFISGTYDHFPTDFFDGYPKITALHDAVAATPKVKAWRDAH